MLGHHLDAAETEEIKSADPRLRRRLKNKPTSPPIPTEAYDADEEPVRARQHRTIRRPKRFACLQVSGCEINNDTSDGKGSPRLPTLLANGCLLDMLEVESAPTFYNADEN